MCQERGALLHELLESNAIRKHIHRCGFFNMKIIPQKLYTYFMYEEWRASIETTGSSPHLLDDSAAGKAGGHRRNEGISAQESGESRENDGLQHDDEVVYVPSINNVNDYVCDFTPQMQQQATPFRVVFYLLYFLLLDCQTKNQYRSLKTPLYLFVRIR